jgi:transposase-like protein
MNSAKILTEQRAVRWSGIIRECRESGLSVAAFCKQTGVNTSRYYYWLKKLRDEACELFVLSRIGEEAAKARDSQVGERIFNRINGNNLHIKRR